jgi:NAD(P)-dependent dehydrogenase (short-subunit alcohol dehydrogenase family)
MPTVFDFRGRVAIVTDGAQGIGRAIAECLSRACLDEANGSI